MARAALRDDGCGCGIPEVTVTVVLDDDRPCDLPPTGIDPTDPPVDPPTGMRFFTIMLRQRTGWSEDGTPMLGWVALTRGISLLFEERSEFDAMAGQTVVNATLKIAYRGTHVVKETCMAVRDDDVRYRVVGVDQYADRLELDMRRIDQDEDDEEP